VRNWGYGRYGEPVSDADDPPPSYATAGRSRRALKTALGWVELQRPNLDARTGRCATSFSASERPGPTR
jgi:hypothetical protein